MNIRFLLLLVILLFAARTHAADVSVPIQIGVAKIPVLSTKPSDPIPTLISRIGELSRESLSITLYPFHRSFKSVERGTIDVHVPFIYHPDFSQRSERYLFSSASLWHVNFVLYTRKDLPVEIGKIEQMNLATNISYSKFFGFKMKPLADMAAAIRMVEAGRIDGIIYPDSVIDPIIKKQGIKNIRRTLFRKYHAKALIHRNGEEQRVDRMISKAMEQLRQSGELDSLNLPSGEYENWQPYDT